MADRPHSTTAYFFKVMGLVALFSIAWQMLISTIEGRFVQDRVEVQMRGKFDALIARDINAMRLLAHEYGVWDETYAYAVDRDPDFIRTNVLPSGDNPGEVDFFVFWDAAGELLFSQRIGAGALEADKLAKLEPLAFALLAERPERSSGRAVLLDGEVYLLGISPILRNDGSGPSRGVFLFARMLSPALLDSYKMLIGGELQMTVIDRSSSAPLVLGTPSGAGFADWYVDSRPVASMRANEGSGLGHELAAGESLQLLFNALGTALLVTLGAMLLRRRIIAPLAELRRQLQQRIHQGVARPVAVQSSLREIGVVVQGINALVDEQARTHAAQRDRDAAQEADRLKSMFLATMSHEIRTPLTGLVGALELASAASSSSERENFLGIARMSSEHLMQLLDDVLDFSRIEADQLILHQQDVALQEIVRDAVSLMRPRAIAKGLYIEADLGQPLTLHTDPVRLRQIVVNLLSNAVKFSSTGDIEVAVRREADDTVEIVVADRGVGIPEDELESIFDPFRQLRGETHRQAGTGLGLAISRRLARALGGELSAQRRRGGGSRFVLRLPNARAADPASVPAATARPVDLSTLRGKRILLADDDESIRVIVVSALSSLGAEIADAHNGPDALALASRERYDLILLDRHMPGLDGLQVARALRAGATPNQRTPIFAMTASTQAEDRRACLEAGMNRFVGKPIKPSELSELIARELQGS